MKKALKTILLAGTLLGLGIAHAQEAKVLPKHPGETLKFDVKLEGQDVQKVKAVSLYLGARNGPLQTDQSGFTSGSRGANFLAIATGTFRPEITIPDNMATGDYYLVVTAIAEPGSADYVSGKQFQLQDFHIDNPKTFVPPSKIEVKEVH
jgi:hypothetical protein